MYRIAGIDVHKRMLAVVVSDVEVAGDYEFESRRWGTTPAQLQALAAWLVEQHVQEVVMESTAQYWRPVWESLEHYWKPICKKQEGARPRSGRLHLAQAQSNRGPRGRKNDFADAERLVKRLVAGELILSLVPDAEQRLWRTVTRAKVQLSRNRVQLQNRLEALLEQAHLKLSSVVSDLLGVSARRMLGAIADGESNPAALADLADPSLRATREELCDALSACQELHPTYRELVKMALEELQLLERQMEKLDQKMATLLSPYQDQVERLAEVPGLGVDSAQQILAEVGASAATFPSAGSLSSWVGACPGQEETAGVNRNHRSPKGNRQMRRLLNLAAHASIKHPGTIFAILYRRYVTRLGPIQTIAVLAHRLCRLIWRILHQGVRYQERGPAVNEKTRRRRTARMIRELRRLGYRIEPTNSQLPVPA
ncbi:MAG TPA: IS110 family transposase [Candidatus Angelobacter sp.]|nr:IS110 family transposase [Candidatus Angelobacter sp.]